MKRKYFEQSSLEMNWLSRDEIGKKVLSIIKLIVLAVLFLLLWAALFSVIPYLAGSERSFSELFRSAFTIEVGIPSSSLPPEFDLWTTVVAIMGLFLSFGFAALAAQVISKPLNRIEIHRRFVVHTDGSDHWDKVEKHAKPYIEFRYFIKRKSGDYLYNVICIFEIISASQNNVGKGSAASIYRYKEHLSMARGVRFVSVPIESIDANDQALLLAMGKFLEHKQSEDASIHPSGRLRISGETAGGQRVSSTQWFSYRDFFNGYKFASIRDSTCREKNKDSDRIYHNHFTKVYPCKNGPYSMLPEGSQVPPAELLKPGDVDPSNADKLFIFLRRCQL